MLKKAHSNSVEGMEAGIVQQEHLSDEMFVLEREFQWKCQARITKRRWQWGRRVHMQLQQSSSVVIRA